MLDPTPLLALATSVPGPRHSVLRKRANNAGIGIELEARDIKFTNKQEKAEKADPENVRKIKGANILLVDSAAKASTDEWRLTVEHTGLEESFGIGQLCAEFVVDGTAVMLGQGKGSKIGKEITDFLAGFLHLLSKKLLLTLNIEAMETQPNGQY